MHEDTHPGVFYSPTENDLQELCRLYEGCIGVPLNNASASVLEAWFEKMEPALIREAVVRTGLYANRPGAPYIRAILKNWDSQGIHSMAELLAKEKIRIGAKSLQSAMRPWWNPGLNYQQHAYTEDDFNEQFYYNPAKDFET